MGLMQKACETYEANLSRAGQVFEAGATLCPVGHILQKAQLEILLDEKGKFLGAQAAAR
jgi:CRISPR-associated protein Csd1